VPKGFENFFPKGQVPPPKKSKNDDDESASDEDKSASESGGDKKTTPKQHPDDNGDSVFEQFAKRSREQQKNGGSGNNNKGGSGGGGGPNQQQEDKQQVGAAIAMLLLVLAARNIMDEEGLGNGREVTWADFRNYMLESGDVDKIEVVNKKYARVYLRPGARGVPLQHRPGVNVLPISSGGGANAGIPPSSQTITTKRRRDVDGEWDDGTVMDLGSVSSDATAAASGGFASRLPGMDAQAGAAGGSGGHQLVYHLNIGSVESFEEKLSRSQQELGIAPRNFVPVQYVTETNWAMELIKSAPMLLMVGVTVYMLRGMGGMGGAGGRGGGMGGMGGMFQIGKSNAKKINKEDVSVTFKDVAGCQEAKKEIMEFVDFLQDSTRFTKLGAKIPKGAMLCGPPGPGKTLLAKAVAGEAGVPFYSISGSDFIEMFVGVGPSRVRDLFKEARQNAPCIIFIDEIDAVGRKRGRGGFSGGNDERENTLNQLLVEMDGFNPSTGVVVLAGTNRVDILDDALTRPGRFDRQIVVDRPDIQGRKEIFMVHLQGITLDGEPEEVAGRLAGLTPGFAGADIANICNEAAIVAARRKAEAVSMEDFEKATDRVIGGLESNKIMSDEERSIVAYHEAGHAVAGWFLEHADPLLKVTIVPRSSGALGYAQYLPKEVFLRTQTQIMDTVCMALAGRAAEQVFFGRVTTGASNDLQKVTNIVYSTIQEYGMNTKVGQLAFPKDPNAGPGDKPYSDATAEAMDEEARRIVDEAYERTLDLITERKEEVEKIAKFLLEQETITHDDVVDCIGPRPFDGDDAYKEYVSKRSSKKEGEDVDAQEEKKEDEEVEDIGGGAGGLTPGLAFRG
jgi:AFG3 family protein